MSCRERAPNNSIVRLRLRCYFNRVSKFFIGFLGAAIALSLLAAEKDVVPQKTGIPVKAKKPAIDENDPVEKEYRKLLDLDDAAQTEVDKWIKEAKAFKDAGAGLPDATLNGRIEQRFSEVRKAYENFLRRHPKHARARLAYGSFLNDIQEEDEAVVHWEKARRLDLTNPAPWNNLANYYGHHSPVKKAFEYYGKAIDLDPTEPVYVQNLATTVYLFRHDAKEYYGITEEQVFNKALELYRKALKLDPHNFTLATDLAQSYYGIRPLRTQEALEAWEYALKTANDDIEREGVYLHMARVELNSGRFDDARRHINMVTNQMYNVLKGRLSRNLQEKETKSSEARASDSATPAKAPGASEVNSRTVTEKR